MAPSIMLAHEKALRMDVIKMLILRVEVKMYALSNGFLSTTISNASIGQLPIRMILGFVSNAVYKGSIRKKPLQIFQLPSELSLRVERRTEDTIKALPALHWG